MSCLTANFTSLKYYTQQATITGSSLIALQFTFPVGAQIQLIRISLVVIGNFVGTPFMDTYSYSFYIGSLTDAVLTLEIPWFPAPTLFIFCSSIYATINTNKI